MKRETFLGEMAVVTAALLLATTGSHAAYPGAGGAVGKNPPATLKSMPGSEIKRVMLTAKAAERLGIEMGKVSERPIVRKRMVGGLVVQSVPELPPQPKIVHGSFGGFAPVASALAPRPAAAQQKAPATGDVWVRVALTRSEWENLAKDQPARILPLMTRGDAGVELLAQPTGVPPLEDVKRSMLQLHYAVPGKKHGLKLNQRMRVELQQ
ncbi:MAG: hypothetical protein JSU71_02090, partial [Betaproteobacteria bacterium]